MMSTVSFLSLNSKINRVLIADVIVDIFLINIRAYAENASGLGHFFTVVCSLTLPLHGSEAGDDPVLIQTSLIL